MAGAFYGDLWSQALAMDIFSEFGGEVPWALRMIISLGDVGFDILKWFVMGI